MAKGKKTGGRRKGSRNKRTVQKVAELVAAYDAGLTPLDYLLGILRDPTASDERRMEAAKNAAPYLHPRLAAIEHAGSVEVVGRLGERLNKARAAIKARELNGSHNDLGGQLLEHEAAHARKIDGMVEVLSNPAPIPAAAGISGRA